MHFLKNYVIVIEHDTDVMKAADWIVDIGPGAGIHGGQIVGQGSLDQLIEQPGSVTGQYLAHFRPRLKAVPAMTRAGEIRVKDAVSHNLRHIEASFPLGAISCVTGVSGSGKSILVFDVIAKGQAEGLEVFDQIVCIEQSPPARMKRSNIATYTDIYGDIRKLYGCTEAAKAKGLTAKHFSFNSPGGRCERCEGMGYITSNMLFFQDIEVVCPQCHGQRFKEEVLAVEYQGKSIWETLNLTVEEALVVFANQRRICSVLKLLCDVGLDYLTLGQTLTTLSAGEAQRLKLARELNMQVGKQMLYLIDEPTTGLHPLDVEHFLVLLQQMRKAGSTVILVEHNLQAISDCDWVIDLGPGGGIRGGMVVAAGTPQELMENPYSLTGKHLKLFLSDDSYDI